MLGSPRFLILSTLYIWSGFAISEANSYVFDSLAHLKDLVNLEASLGELLKIYVDKQQEKFEALKAFAKLVRNNTDQVKEKGLSYLDSPVNQYAIIKRFSRGWSQVESLLEEDENYSDLLRALEGSRTQFPSDDEKDLLGAIAAVFRLQNTYNLTARSFVEGKIPGCKATSQMSADDCYELGVNAYRGGQYGKARDWTVQALRLAKYGQYEAVVSIQDILMNLAWMEHVAGNTEKALQLNRELLQLEPNDEVAQKNAQYFKNALKNPGYTDYFQIKASEERTSTEHFINSDYAKLCRGEPIVASHVQRNLKCWYHGRRSPRLMLKPAKLEMINDKPRVYIYRDFISDSEAEQIKELAKPMLRRATVYNPTTGVLENADYRVSKSAWLEESQGELVRRINNRAHLVTGLDKSTVENLQVANYGMGGQYDAHLDHGLPGSPLDRDPRGNRIATLLIYLNEVASGGGTVFLEAGIQVPPSKGDAAFWFNLKRSGQGDPLTKHAACPVLCGNKWVANKWFHEKGNMFRRRCKKNSNL